MPSADLEHVTDARKGSARTPRKAVSGTKIAHPSSTLTLIHSANHPEVQPVSKTQGSPERAHRRLVLLDPAGGGGH